MLFMAQILYFQGTWWDYISFTLPYKTMHVFTFTYIYAFSFFFKVDVSSHQTNMSMFIVNKLPQFLYTLPLLGSLIPSLSHKLAEAAALLATGTGCRADLLRAFRRLCRASALALRGARREGRWGEAAKKAYFWGGILCISQGTWWTQQNGGEWFRWFSCSVGWFFRVPWFDLMCVYAGLVCQ